MKFAVVGAGAMGCLIGGLLGKSGQDVVLIDVWKDHVEKMNKDGLFMKDEFENENLVKVKAYESAKEINECVDVVILLVKGTNTESAIKEALPIISKDTVVITLQNGLGNAEKISEVVDENQIMFGVIEASSILEGPGKISYQLAEGNVYIKPASGKVTEKMKNIADIFKAAKINAHVSLEADKKIWEKLVINSNFNALSAITGVNIGTILKEHHSHKFLRNITSEIVKVANAEGINLDLEKCLKHLDVFGAEVKYHYPSMAQDMAKKRQTEVDFINGHIVREGKKLGIPVPVNETLYNIIKTMQNTFEAERL